MMDCPEVVHKQAGDESYDICNLDSHQCGEEHGYGCDIYNEHLQEEFGNLCVALDKAIAGLGELSNTIDELVFRRGE